MLGVMAFFGMSISEIFTKQKEIENLKKLDHEKEILEVKRKSEMIVNEANLKAEKIIFEANKRASEILNK
ncbi:MAG: hypothetical protein IPM32_11245 [Ignavibacteriae bacterium]|nr:hypothetical protein [Ignavibacteriota bacterium]